MDLLCSKTINTTIFIKKRKGFGNKNRVLFYNLYPTHIIIKQRTEIHTQLAQYIFIHYQKKINEKFVFVFTIATKSQK